METVKKLADAFNDNHDNSADILDQFYNLDWEQQQTSEAKILESKLCDWLTTHEDDEWDSEPSTETDEAIEALRLEAIELVDNEQAEMCTKALAGDARSRERCGRVILLAEASSRG